MNSISEITREARNSAKQLAQEVARTRQSAVETARDSYLKPACNWLSRHADGSVREPCHQVARWASTNPTTTVGIGLVLLGGLALICSQRRLDAH